MIHGCCGTLTGQTSLVGDAQSCGWFPKDSDALAQVAIGVLSLGTLLEQAGQGRAGSRLHSFPQTNFLKDMRTTL